MVARVRDRRLRHLRCRLGVAAIVLANNAQRKIAASNGTLTGYGLARAGRILGIIAAVVGIAVLAIFVNQR